MRRDVFVAGVRTAVASAHLPDASLTDPGLLVPDLPPGDLIEMFVANLSAIDGMTVRTPAVAAPSEIARIVADIDDRYMAWDDAALAVAGLPEALAGAGLERVAGVVPLDAAGRRHRQQTYRDLRVGITGADAGLAESGSLVLVSGPGRPRMASLIPLHHVAVLRASHIVRSLPHLLGVRRDLVARGSNFVVITGPSRTADIEMTLTLGVHGPRHVTVVLIED